MWRVLFLTMVLMSSTVFSQTLDKIEQKETAKAEKVDEFGDVGEELIQLSLDNFLVTLHRNPKLKGVIIFYQGKDVLPARYNEPLTKLYKNHFNFRGFDSSRIDVINAGFREKQTTEIWLVPEGAVKPKPSGTISPPKTPKNKTYLYDHIYIDATNFFLPRKDENEETDIPDEDAREWDFYWINKNFAAKIKEQKGSRGVIVYYADDEYHDLPKILTHLSEAKRRLAKDGKIAFDKFEIVFGGYRGGIEFELWIVPKNGEMPPQNPDVREPEITGNK